MASSKTASTEPDDILIRRTRARDASGGLTPDASKAFGALYDRHGPPIYSLLRSHFPGYAKDILQEAFQTAMIRLDQFQEGNFRAWVNRIAMNLGYSRHRKKQEQELIEDRQVMDYRNSPLDDREQDQTLQQHQEILKHCLERLKETELRVVRDFFAGKSHKEIAQRMAALGQPINETQSQQLKYSAVQKLRQCAGEETIMSLVCAGFPDTLTEQLAWMEQHLTGSSLGYIVSEWTLLRSKTGSKNTPTKASLSSIWSADQIQAVAQDGLTQAFEQKILTGADWQKLLAYPQVLLELQEKVLLEGSPFWDNLIQETAHDRNWDSDLASVRENLFSLPQSVSNVTPSRSVPETMPISFAAPVESPRTWRVWLVSMSTAAVLFVAAYLNLPKRNDPVSPQGEAVAWGWSRSDAIPKEGNATNYLNALADAAGEWSKKRPESAADLGQRILELRTGCNKLIMAEHPLLAAADRQWLKEKCQDWAKKFDSNLVALENGEAPLEVRGRMDATVEKLMQALRQRGTEIEARSQKA